MFNLFRHVERMKKSFDMLPKTATFDMLLRHVAGVDGALRSAYVHEHVWQHECVILVAP